MTEQPGDDLKEREFQLKLLQAWTDGKTKVATAALLGNVGLLATAFAYMKDKGPDSPSIFALSAAEAGFMGALLAYGVALSVSDHSLKQLIERKESPLGWISSKLVDLIYAIGIVLAVGGFLSTLAFFSGYTDGSQWCLKNKEACLEKPRADKSPKK